VQRTLLAIGAPVILFIGGLWAFSAPTNSGGNAAPGGPGRAPGWFLLILMLLALTMGLPAIASPVIGG
jgi:hypothetical protein